jgi:hypothetical protein
MDPPVKAPGMTVKMPPAAVEAVMPMMAFVITVVPPAR